MYIPHSILLPVFNGKKYLDQQILSILSEMEKNDELIIYDDGSADNSLKICNFYAESDCRVKVFRGARNIGLRRSINYLLTKISNELIVFVDQDDVWLAGRLRDIQKFFPQNDCVVINAELCDSDLRLLKCTYFDLVGHTSNFFNMMLRCRVLGCCMVLKKSSLEGSFTIPNGCWHDHYIILWLMLRCKTIYYHHEPLVLYRRHGETLSLAGSSNNIIVRAPAIIFNRLVLLVSILTHWFRIVILGKSS
jgi:glycosyltransferase involved in cell wall biosynthesis